MLAGALLFCLAPLKQEEHGAPPVPQIERLCCACAPGCFALGRRLGFLGQQAGTIHFGGQVETPHRGNITPFGQD